MSLVPVAAAAGAEHAGTHSLWLATIGPAAPKQARIELHRLALEPTRPAAHGPPRDRDRHLQPTAADSCSGEPERGLEPHGRLMIFGGGVYYVPSKVGASDKPWAEQIVSMNVGPRAGGGAGSTGATTATYIPAISPAAQPPVPAGSATTSPMSHGCATMPPNETIACSLGFYGSGAFETVSDFNDAAFIAEVGLSHSLPFVLE